MSVLQVAPAVKTLSSEQLVKFQEDGEITVEGHTLTTEDIKVTVHHHGNITTVPYLKLNVLLYSSDVVMFQMSLPPLFLPPSLTHSLPPSFPPSLFPSLLPP